MDFDPPEAVRPLLERIEKFVAEVVIPAEATVLAQGFTASAAVLDDLRAQCKAAQLWGPQLPAELGGLGLGLVAHGLVSERLGRSPLGHYVFGAQAPDAGNLEILHKYGTAEQKDKWLEPLAHGRIRSCFSMTEPENPGSNPTMLSCRDQIEVIGTGAALFSSRLRSVNHALPGRICARHVPGKLHASMLP